MTDNESAPRFDSRQYMIAAGIALGIVSIAVLTMTLRNSLVLSEQNRVLAALRAKGGYGYRQASFLGQIEPTLNNGPVKKIHLLGPQFDNTDVQRLLVFPNLQDLGLSDSSVTDACMEHICQLQNLETLTLDGTQITDGAIRRLSQLPKLKSVNLSRTRMSDSGLALLSQCKSITDIVAGPAPNPTREAVEKFRSVHQGTPRLHY